MRYTQAFIPTQKEAPKDAIMPSHVLLLRGGYVRMVGAGIYEFLPLGMRVLTKIANIVRYEMDKAGAQEVLMPALLPAEYFRESGRWDSFGDTLLRLSDRKKNEYHLGPTHEEIITDMVRREVRSYRQLPINLYQIQNKFRDEARPRAGLLRCREFMMKDAYSFDVNEEGALKSYATMREAYHAIFKRLGLEYRVVAADSGAMGGSTSAEFQVLAQNGEDAIVACTDCEYAANVEVATAGEGASAAEPAPQSTTPIEKIHTPKASSIDDVVAFLTKKGHSGVERKRLIKSLVYVAGKDTVLALVRGDHEVNEIKLARALGVPEVFMASDTEVERATGARVGFAGPVGFKGKIIADRSVASMHDAFTGANESDQHLAHVRYGRDFEATLADIRQVTDGDPCPKCGKPLKAYRGIEGGHIFVLGTHYSAKMDASFLDEAGQKKAIVMGCYGIGVSRLVATAVEQHHDADGISWPMAIAPYQVMLTTLGKDEAVAKAADELYAALQTCGVEVLYDDRDERPGVKFKDADLLGIPLRVTIGARGLAAGELELKKRTEKEPTKVALAIAANAIRDAVVEAGGRLGAA